MTDRDACIVLNMIPGIGSAKLSSLVSSLGSPAAVFKASENGLAAVSGIGRALASRIYTWKDSVDFEHEMEMAEKGGVKIISCVEADYPPILKEIYDPPICLYVRGEIPDISARSIAVVGSRRITNYGRRMAKHLAESAAYAGWTVISGLAYGVDAVAHQAVLDAGGETLAVLGGGLARVHPQDHLSLARDITQHGAVISEFPMEFPPSRQSFPRRNRIISGLSRAVLVVEAGVKSGALITAELALEQGRAVFSVPGCADNPQARGCNALIKQGAKLTESFEDVLEEFEFLPGMAPAAVREDNAEYSELPGSETRSHFLSDEEKEIIAVIGSDEKSIDSIAAGSGTETGRLLSVLMKLEMKKIIEQLPGRIYRVRG